MVKCIYSGQSTWNNYDISKIFDECFAMNWGWKMGSSCCNGIFISSNFNHYNRSVWLKWR